MRDFYARTGNFSLREHRMLMNVDRPSFQPELEAQIDQDVAYMDGDFKRIIEQTQEKAGVTLTPERAAGVERQRQAIRGKLEDIRTMQFRYREQYLSTRNAVVNQVHQLVAYAQFQTEQQKELESTRAEPLPVEQQEEQGTRAMQYWIQSPENQPFSFSYIRSTPGAAKLVGTITLDARTVSTTMQGCFRVQRSTYEGKHYYVVTVDPAFEGTFTFLNQGKRATVDVALPAARDAEANRDPVPFALERVDPTGPAESRQMIREWRAMVAELSLLNKDRATLTDNIARQGRDPNLADAVAELRRALGTMDTQIEELKARADSLERRIDEADRRKSEADESRGAVPDRLTQIPVGDTRIRQLYTWIRTNDGGLGQWFSAEADKVPGGVAGAEYRIAEDGYLYSRRRDNAADRGAISTYRTYRGGRWVDCPRVPPSDRPLPPSGR